ncbi:MAG: hypothetical protein E6H39_07535 [Betaproteobacteria bacterium]|nr:MAG: hypothetical protein E6H39_07535 [Betaproteobacteria bacterium]
MKPTVLLLALALAAPAWPQAPELKPAPTPVVSEAAKPAAKRAAKTAVKRHRRWHEDARHCLELPTNIEIIKCAEVYL